MMSVVGTHTMVSDVADAYEQFAAEDDRAAVELLRAGRYRHALYQTIQAMEKRVRAAAVRISDSPEEFCRRMKGHSLKEALDELISAVSSNELARRQVEELLYRDVLEGTKFAMLHNDLRYPFYLPTKRSFAVLAVSREEAESMLTRSRRLSAYLSDINRLRSASG